MRGGCGLGRAFMYPFYQYLVLVAVLVLLMVFCLSFAPAGESLGGRSHCEHCGRY